MKVDATAPTLTTTSATTINQTTTAITVKSNENGFIYLVPKATYTDKATLEAVTSNVVKTATANTDVTFAVN